MPSLEKKLWSSADTLRANSNYASNEYFLPVMGLIFLKHAFTRYNNIKNIIINELPERDGEKRKIKKEDFSSRGSIYLKEVSQFEYLASLPSDINLAEAIILAMKSIEEDYDSLVGVLPKQEYHELDNEVISSLLRVFNDPELSRANGDVFGNIYEYFLTQFADQKAHDNGEFFTPTSLVQTIVNVIEPNEGIVFDPACGSGGMFVQSAHFLENQKINPNRKIQFYGTEKNPTTIRLAKMNLAVHGLEGNIKKAITYYENPLKMNGKADFVMANPPFNVDEVDAEKIRNDPRLVFGLPAINKKKKITNANYLWMQYFSSSLNKSGRAGIVMSAQSSSAGKAELEIRKQMISSDLIDVMIDIKGGFFYTRTVPCQLWFLNKKKNSFNKDKVLMIDARNIFRKKTRKVSDFSPEQIKNISAIVWLYRKEHNKFLKLIENYYFTSIGYGNRIEEGIANYFKTISDLGTYFNTIKIINNDEEIIIKEINKLINSIPVLKKEIVNNFKIIEKKWKQIEIDIDNLEKYKSSYSLFVDGLQKFIKIISNFEKFSSLFLDIKIKTSEDNSNNNDLIKNIKKILKTVNIEKESLKENINKTSYYFYNANWLQKRFPKGEITNVEGLIKVADRDDLIKNKYSLSPGRYVGIAPEEVDPNFDFYSEINSISNNLKKINDEISDLSKQVLLNIDNMLKIKND